MRVKLLGDAHHAAVFRMLHQTDDLDRKSTRLNSSHGYISYAVFCLKKKKHRHLLSSWHGYESTIQSSICLCFASKPDVIPQYHHGLEQLDTVAHQGYILANSSHRK